MTGDDAELHAREDRLQLAEDELRRRAEQALAEHPTPAALLALAVERDRIARARDALAADYDEHATSRDRAGLDRDVAGSGRDRDARTALDDVDAAFADRVLAGADRDLAAGDRGDSVEDRQRARRTRARAGQDRERAADDRDTAAAEAAGLERRVDNLEIALESRLVIGRAEGLLMARHGISAAEAFAVLVRFSQESNSKLRDVAAQLIADAGSGR